MKSPVIDVYSDGSINTFKDLPEESQNLAGIGIFIPKNDLLETETKIKHGLVGRTINATELLAIHMALDKLNQALTKSEKETARINIFSDSKLAIDGLTIHHKKWKNNLNEQKQWLKSNNEPVENQEIFKEIINIKSNFYLVNFAHVKGHSNDPNNDEADRLAKEAVSDLYLSISDRLSKRDKK